MKNNYKKKSLNEIKKSLFIIDMNNGFVNFGTMSNPKYNQLVPEQLKIIEIFREENELVNFILESHDDNSIEFKKYPHHCKKNTEEAKLIKELVEEQIKLNTRTYYKNSINGMLNRKLQDDILKLKGLKQITIAGVCADLCIMDFTLTLLRFLDEFNIDTNVILIKSTIDTFDSPDYNREEWLNIAYKVLNQAGAIIVEDVEEYLKVLEKIENKEKKINNLVRRKKYGK